MKQRIITAFFLGIAMCLLLFIPDLQAPEITERDMYGYESYNIEEDGAVCNRGGAIKGWITENAVYDAYWNIRYHIHEGRHYRAEEGERSNGKT